MSSSSLHNPSLSVVVASNLAVNGDLMVKFEMMMLDNFPNTCWE